jgi:enterochelin esterase-like enzyme
MTSTHKKLWVFAVFCFVTLCQFTYYTSNALTLNSQHQSVVIVRDTSLFSKKLNRNITLDIILPPHYQLSNKKHSVLYMNDGQDLESLQLGQVLTNFFANNDVEPFILVAIHCNHERLLEYGVAAQADYKNRGSKAQLYSQFVLEELRPHIAQQYRILTDAAHTAFCGFSLGGLSAFDLVWHNEQVFSRVGAFSASFWWRQKAYDQNYREDHDRIIHNLVRKTAQTPKIKAWIQTGTDDEQEDRNKNGIIDSIDDALDLIAEMETNGLKRGHDIRYVEVKGGQHNQRTWSAIFPDFLLWAFGR